jgi:hypothetical protein
VLKWLSSTDGVTWRDINVASDSKEIGVPHFPFDGWVSVAHLPDRRKMELERP